MIKKTEGPSKTLLEKENTNSSETNSKNGVKVLVVDDEPALSELVARVVQIGGDTSINTNSPEHALSIIEEDENKDIRIIISDISMPVINGLELVKKIEKIREDIAVILMSGYFEDYYDDDDDHNDIIKNTICIEKPFDIKKLLQTVERTKKFL